MQFENFQPKTNGPLSKRAADKILFIKKKHGTWKKLTDNIPIKSVQPVTLNNLVTACLDNPTKQPTRNLSTETAEKLYRELFPQNKLEYSPKIKLEHFPLLTKELINNYQIQQINDICKSTYDHHSLASNFSDKYKNTNNKATKQMCSMLSQVFDVMLSFKNPSNPYEPVVITHNGRSMIFTDLTRKNLKFLSYINSKIKNPLFNSRINDLLWLTKYKEGQNNSPHLYAEEAFDNFCEISKIIFKKGFEYDNYPYGRDYFKRATQLWKQLNLNQDKFETLTKLAILGMHLDKPEPENYLRFLVMEIAVELELFEDPKILKNKMISLAKEALDNKDFEKAKTYLDILIKLLNKSNGNNEEVSKYREKIGDIMIEKARHSISKEGALVTVNFYIDAIEYNKNLKNRKEIVNKLEKELDQIQKKAISEMEKVTFKVPIPKELKEEGRKAVTGKPYKEAIKNIASMVLPKRLSLVEEMARKNVSAAPLLNCFAHTQFDTREKIISRKNHKRKNAESDKIEPNVMTEMIMIIFRIISIRSFTKLEEARQILYKAEMDNEKIFQHLVEENSFVPKGRERLFEEGLKYGLEGNWLCSSHILIPQLEHSIRTVMEMFGATTKKLKPDQTQKEPDLNYLLSGANQTEAENIWGKDFIFELKVLLIEKSGFNFRNRVCHGFLDEDTFSNPCPNIYLWATTLHLLHWGKELNKNIRKFVQSNSAEKSN